ncbi:DUF6176 family protein [Lentzea sp. NPDC034063]|uniref:DUF6176 family protein n=1 Tax=unclassified Lentzea TaxID=2643253 RepID=UPI0033F8CB46
MTIRVTRVEPSKVDQLRTWLATARLRADEVRATFVDEGVRHERAMLVDTSDGPLLIYAVECEDFDAATAAFAKSTHPIDQEHKQVMAEVRGTPVEVEDLLDLWL